MLYGVKCVRGIQQSKIETQVPEQFDFVHHLLCFSDLGVTASGYLSAGSGLV
jgi:hypothetical protein